MANELPMNIKSDINEHHTLMLWKNYAVHEFFDGGLKKKKLELAEPRNWTVRVILPEKKELRIEW